MLFLIISFFLKDSLILTVCLLGPSGEHWEEVKMRGSLSQAQSWKNNGRVVILRPDGSVIYIWASSRVKPFP